MKRLAMPLVAAAIALIAVFATATLSTPSAQTKSQRDVVILRCAASTSGIEIVSYSQSSSAPAKRASSCAETISTLHRDGFSVEMAAPDSEEGHWSYLMVR